MSQVLQCAVPSFSVDSDGHTDYLVVTMLGGRRFTASQRFSAFIRLHEAVAADLGLHPVFPVAKSMFNKSMGLKRRRRSELNDYVELLAHLSGPRPCAALLSFLSVDPAAASVGEAALRDVVSRATGAISERELFVKRVLSAGPGDDGAVGGERAAEADDDAEAAPAPVAKEEFELSRDAYATAFVLACNATEGMYSIWPWRSRQLWPLWGYLLFISLSQILVLASCTLVHPPSVDTQSLIVNCEAPDTAALDALEAAATRAAFAGRVREALASTLALWPHAGRLDALEGAWRWAWRGGVEAGVAVDEAARGGGDDERRGGGGGGGGSGDGGAGDGGGGGGGAGDGGGGGGGSGGGGSRGGSGAGGGDRGGSGGAGGGDRGGATAAACRDTARDTAEEGMCDAGERQAPMSVDGPASQAASVAAASPSADDTPTTPLPLTAAAREMCVSLPTAFVVPIAPDGRTARYRRLDVDVPFYANVFGGVRART